MGADLPLLRHAVLQRFAPQLRDLVERGRRDHPEVRELAPAMSTALVGGINELVLATLQEGGVNRLDQLEDTIAELVGSVLRPTAPTSA